MLVVPRQHYEKLSEVGVAMSREVCFFLSFFLSCYFLRNSICDWVGWIWFVVIGTVYCGINMRCLETEIYISPRVVVSQILFILLLLPLLPPPHR